MPVAWEVEEEQDLAPSASVTIPPVAPGQPNRVQLAYQNNNPGNLEYAKQPGATQNGSFAKFDSPESGYEALRQHIQSRADKGDTLGDYINSYAPPSENDTEQYIRDAEKSLGANRTAKLSSVDREKLAAFQANKESSSAVWDVASESPVSNTGWEVAGETPITAPDVARGTVSSTAIPPTTPLTVPPGLTTAQPEPGSVPALPTPPAPGELQTPADAKARAIANNAPLFINPRTGARYYGDDTGTGPLGVLDAPVQGVEQIARGAEQMAEPLSRRAPIVAGPSSIVPAQPPPVSPSEQEQLTRQFAGGVGNVLGGAMKAGTPAMVGEGVIAPVEAAIALGLGTASTEATHALLKKLDVPEEYDEVASTLAGLVGAAGGGVITGIPGMIRNAQFRAALKDFLQNKVNREYAERQAQERAAMAPKQIAGPAPEAPPTPPAGEIPPPGVPPVQPAGGAAPDLSVAPEDFLKTPAAATSPAPSALSPGSSFELPSGTYTVTKSDNTGVQFDQKLPDGSVVPGQRLPLSLFTKLAAKATNVSPSNGRDQELQQSGAVPESQPGSVQPPVEDQRPAGLRGLPVETGGGPGSAQPEPPPPAQGADTAGSVRRVTGSADIPLSSQGEQQASELASKLSKPFDQVITGTDDRLVDTAKNFSDSPTQVPAFDGWARGEDEGKPVDQVADKVSSLMLNPDSKPEGVSPISGEPGQSFNQFKLPTLQNFDQVEKNLPPQGRALVVLTGGGLQIVDAWKKAGSPSDFQFDHAEMAKKPYWSATGQLFKSTDKGLQKVSDDAEPGVYLTEHAATSFNPPKSVKAQPEATPLPKEVSLPAPTLPEAEEARYPEALQVVREAGKASPSILQRKLRMGYGQAARMLDRMEKEGIIGPADGSKPRELLKPAATSETPSSLPAAGPEPQVEKLQYRSKGNDKIDVHIGNHPGKGWQVAGNFNLQGQAGGHLGTSGFDKFYPTREEAIQEFLKSATRPQNALTAKLPSDVPEKTAKRQQAMIDWIKKLQPEPTAAAKPPAAEPLKVREGSRYEGEENPPEALFEGARDQYVGHANAARNLEEALRNPKLTPKRKKELEASLANARQMAAATLNEIVDAFGQEGADKATEARAAAQASVGQQNAPTEKKAHDYSSTQVNLPQQFADAFRKAAAKIPDSDLAEDGRETEPHITVFYGLHTNEPADVQKLIADQGPIKANIGRISIFPASKQHPDYDVLKLAVDSEGLKRLNKKLSKLPNGNEFPEYKPHVTIAYVKAGEGKKYAGRAVPGLTGKQIEFDRVHFMPKTGERTDIPLGAQASSAAATPGRQQEPQKSKTGEKNESKPTEVVPQRPAHPPTEATPSETSEAGGSKGAQPGPSSPRASTSSISERGTEGPTSAPAGEGTETERAKGESAKTVKSASGLTNDQVEDLRHAANDAFVAKAKELGLEVEGPSKSQSFLTREPNGKTWLWGAIHGNGRTLVPSAWTPLNISAMRQQPITTTREKPTKATAKKSKPVPPLIARRREFYTPGNVIFSGYWHTYDKVLAYDEKPGGGWTLTEQRVNEDGSPIAGEQPRTHSTPPDKGSRIVSRASVTQPTDYLAPKSPSALEGAPAPEQPKMPERAAPSVQKKEQQAMAAAPKPDEVPGTAASPGLVRTWIESLEERLKRGKPASQEYGNLLEEAEEYRASANLQTPSNYEYADQVIRDGHIRRNDALAKQKQKVPEAKKKGPPIEVKASTVTFGKEKAENGRKVFTAYGVDAEGKPTGERVDLRQSRNISDGWDVERKYYDTPPGEANKYGRQETEIVGAGYPKAEARAVAEAFLKGEPSPFAKAEAGLPMSEYKPGSGKIEDPGDSRFGFNGPIPFKGGVWHTNGHILVEGAPPKYWTPSEVERKGPDISKVIPNKGGKTVTPVGFYKQGAHEYVVFSNGGVMDSGYFDYLNKAHKPDKWTAIATNEAFQAHKGSKLVGLVMPIRNDAVPEKLRSLTALASEPVSIEGSRIPHLPEDVRNAQYISEAPNGFHARRAVIEPIPIGPQYHDLAVAYLGNQSAMELVARAGNKTQDSIPFTHAALHISPRDTFVLSRNLGRLFPHNAPEPVRRLREMLDSAGPAGKSFILVSDSPAMDQHRDTAFTEELHHALQATLQGTATKHFGESLSRFTGSPVYEKAALHLSRTYSDLAPDSPEQATEVAVRLMRPQGYQELGLSVPDARSLAAQYVRTLRREYGSKAPGRIAREVFSAFGPERAPSESQELPGGPATERGEGPSGSSGPDISAYRPEESSFSDEQPRPGPDESPTTTDREVRPRKTRDVVPGKRGERGSAPALGDLIQTGYEGARGGNYSVRGAVESSLIRGLGQTKRASPPVHEAMLRGASPEARSAAIIRASLPLMRKALEGTGVPVESLFLYYVDSRLQGIRDRWQDFANQAQKLTDEQMEKDFSGGGEEGSMSQDFVDMLDNLQGRAGMPENPAQIASALVEQKRWEDLRNYLWPLFETAANNVRPAMDTDHFDHIRDQIKTNPKVKEADRIYGERIEHPIAQNHALNEGVFTTALGPAGRYFPLLAAEEGKPTFFEKLGFKKPGNSRNVMATGLSKKGYVVDIERFRQALARDLSQGGRASVIQAAYDAGLMKKVPRSSSVDTDTFLWRGKEYPTKKVTVTPPRMVIKQGEKSFYTQAVQAYMPKWFYDEIKDVVDKDSRPEPGAIHRALQMVNTFALQGPADMTFHSANLVGALIANTPFLSSSLGGMLASSNILTKKFQALGMLATTDPTKEEAVQAFQEMADAGALPTRYASVTYSKELAKLTGAKLVRYSLSPMLYGPKGIDARARYIMWRVAKAINPNVSPQELNEFVNQLGNYTPALWSDLEKHVKAFPFSPFYTAGSTMIRNGVNAMFSSGPTITPGEGKAPWVPKNKAQLRLWHALTAGILGTLGVWFLLSKELTGKYPWEDKRSKFLSIPVGSGAGRIDKFRHSTLGNTLWGKGPEVGYVNVYAFNPLIRRGAMALGVPGAYQTLMERGTGGQAREAGMRDIVNTFSHPVLGPLPRAAVTATLSKEPYLTGFRDRSGKLAPELMSAIPDKTPAGWPTTWRTALAAAAQLNAFANSIGDIAGLQGNEKREQEAARVKVGPVKINATAVLNNVLNMSIVGTGLIGNSTNPFAAEHVLQQQRAATASSR